MSVCGKKVHHQRAPHLVCRLRQRQRQHQQQRLPQRHRQQHGEVSLQRAADRVTDTFACCSLHNHTTRTNAHNNNGTGIHVHSSRIMEQASTSSNSYMHTPFRNTRQHTFVAGRLNSSGLKRRQYQRTISRAADMERVCSSVTPDDLWKTIEPKLQYLTRDQQLLVR